MFTLYGIKNCDTVKKARRWLEDNNVEFTFHDFRADGLNQDQVQAWLDELGHAVLVNKRSTTWKQLDDGQKDQALGNAAAALLVEHPTLIKRPVLDTGKQRQVGFSAANYQALL